MTLLYRIIVKTAYIYLKIFRNFKVYGENNIPTEGPVIFAPNHIANIDPFVVSAGTKKRIGYMAKKELFFFPLGNLLLPFGIFPVDRTGNATGAIKSSLAILETLSLAVFPEGTRNQSEELLLPAKRGVALIAYKSQKPVVPVAIKGSPGLFGRITIEYGKPVTCHINHNGETKVKKDYNLLLDSVMSSIEEMLLKN